MLRAGFGGNTRGILLVCVLAMLFVSGATAQEGDGVAVTVVETNSPVLEGEQLTVTTSMENSGESVTAERVSLRVGGAVRDTAEVRLEGGENRTVTLVWQTGDGDAGSYTASVATPNDTAERDVEVQSIATDPGIEVPATNVTVGDTVAFSADVGPDISEYEWRVNGTLVGRESGLSYTFREPGTFSFELTVRDDAGVRARAVRVVRVNAPPSVTLQTETVAGHTAEFLADASDPDGSVQRYEWLVDGETIGTGSTLSYTFDTAGQHEVRLVVVDDSGATTNATAVVTIETAQPDNGADDGIPVPGFGVGVAVLGIGLSFGIVAARRAIA